MKKKIKKKKTRPHYYFVKIVSVYLSIIAILAIGSIFIANQKSFCANSLSCIKDLSGVYNSSEKSGVYLGKKVSSPKELAINDNLLRPVLGDSTGGEKHIYVDLATQTLTAKEGDKIVFSFPVSTGKWHHTPTGDFRIWAKLKYTLMSGGNQSLGTYYYLPNVPFTMFFYNSEYPKSDGYGLHGAYWHNNFGHPMSHGCINIKTENAEKLFYWANPESTGHLTYATTEDPGTVLTVYGETPVE